MLIHIAQREFAANAPKFHRGDAALFPAELLFHLRLDGQTMAIPSGDVRCSEAGHGLRFDHHVLENLVQGGSQVNCPCGIGWSIVQDIGRSVGARLLNAVVKAVLLPLGQNSRLILRKVGLHREIGLGEIQRAL